MWEGVSFTNTYSANQGCSHRGARGFGPPKTIHGPLLGLGKIGMYPLIMKGIYFDFHFLNRNTKHLN